MPVLPGVHICTPDRSVRASVVIKAMKSLLDQRKSFKVTRRVFLDRWSRLRKGLLVTEDYQKLIDRVRSRAGGTCEFCNRRLGEQVHHEEPVAFNVDRALDDKNCKWTCTQCHAGEDKKSRLRSRRDAKSAAKLPPAC